MATQLNQTYTIINTGGTSVFFENTTSYYIELYFSPEGTPPPANEPPHKVVVPLDFFSTELIPSTLFPTGVWARCNTNCEVSIL